MSRVDSEHSSLPPSSPVPFSDTDDSLDERDAVQDAEDEEAEEEDGDGEDLFGAEMREYVSATISCIFVVNIR